MDERRIQEWVEAELITAQQADGIMRFEDEHPGEGSFAHGRVPLVTEALGYLGMGLAAAAMVVLLSEQWSTLAVGWQLTVALASTTILLVAGWLLRDVREPAFSRFGTVVWALAVPAGAWAATIWARDVMGLSNEPLLAVEAALVAAILAVPLYVLRRTILQLLALGGSTIALATSLVTLSFDEPPDADPAVGVVVWALGLAWLLLAHRGVLIPQTLAYGMGAFAAVQAPSAFSSAGGWIEHAGMALGLLTAAGLIAASIWLHSRVILAFGAIGLFLYLIGTVEHFFRDTLGTPLVLLLTGVILLAVALLTMRLRRFTGPHPPAAHAG